MLKMKKEIVIIILLLCIISSCSSYTGYLILNNIGNLRKIQEKNFVNSTIPAKDISYPLNNKDLYGDFYGDLMNDTWADLSYSCWYDQRILLPSEMNNEIKKLAAYMREHNYEKAKNVLNDTKTYPEWDKLLITSSIEYLTNGSNESLRCIKSILNKYTTTYFDNLAMLNTNIDIKSPNDFMHLFYNQDIHNAEHLITLLNSYSIIEDELGSDERLKIKNYLSLIESDLYQYLHNDIHTIRWNNHEFIDYIAIGIYAIYFKNETLITESEFYIKKMLDEFVNSEGFWFEDSTYYHNLILFNLLRYIEAKKIMGYKNNFWDPKISKYIKKMFNFLLTVSYCNNGTYMIPQINDGYIQKLDQRIIDLMCREYGDDYKDLCSNHPVTGGSLALPESGLVIFKSKFPSEQVYFILDFGKPLEFYRDSYFIKKGGYHENYNKLSFNINYKNTWIINEDKYQYKKDYRRIYNTLGKGGMAYSYYDYFNYYKQTWSKNTIVVDRKAQKECSGNLEGSYFSDNTDIVSIRADSCYPRVTINRKIYFLKPNIFIIRDDISSNEVHIYESFIHSTGNLIAPISNESYDLKKYTCYSSNIEHKGLDFKKKECEYILNFTILNGSNFKFAKNNIGANIFFLNANSSIIKHAKGDSGMPLISLETFKKDFSSVMLIEVFEGNQTITEVDIINNSFDNSLLKVDSKVINLNELDKLIIK